MKIRDSKLKPRFRPDVPTPQPISFIPSEFVTCPKEVLTIRRVEVEPIGGGKVRPAYVAASKPVEPGEVVDFQIWAELESRETVMGVGGALAKVIVSFDDDMEKVLGTYLVKLE